MGMDCVCFRLAALLAFASESFMLCNCVGLQLHTSKLRAAEELWELQ